jgi:hypothetical protein
VAAKVLDVAPAFTVADAGALSVGFVLDNVTVVPPAGAALVSVIVQVVEAFRPRLAGLHDSDVTPTEPRRPTLVVALPLFSVAVIIAVWSLAIVPAADAAKLPVVAPFVTTTPAGMVRLELLVLMTTELEPTDAWVSVTVHVAAEPPDRLVGLQLTELGTATAVRLMVELAELLPKAAVTVADWLLETAVVLALKVAVVAAANTVTDAGTLRVALVLVIVTLAPPAGAALVRVTVQVVDALAPRLVGLQASEDTRVEAARLTVALAELLL